MKQLDIHLAWLAAIVVTATWQGSAQAAVINDLPASVQGNVVTWVEAETGVTTDAFGVTSWQNIEGTAGRDFAQTIDNRKPQYVPSVAAINGKPVVSFDGLNNGTADHLDTSDTGIMKGRSQFEILLVGNIDPNSNDYARILSEESGGAGNRIFNFGLDNASPRKIRTVMDTTGGVPVLAEPVSSTGSFHLYGMRLDPASGGTLAIEVDGNGVSAAASTVGSLKTNVTSILRMGGPTSSNAANNDHAGVDVAEVIVFDRQLTDRERSAIGFALESKYGLATQFEAPVNTVTTRRVLVDFAGVNANNQTSDPNGTERWNDVTSYGLNTTIAANLIDTTGAATGFDLHVGAGGGSSGTPTYEGGGWDLPGVTPTGFPESATRDGMVIHGAGNNVFADLELRNLDPNKLYDLEMYVQASGTRDFVGWQIGGVTNFLSPNAPQTGTVTFESISPDALGVIPIRWFAFDDPIGGKTGSAGNDSEWSLLAISETEPAAMVPEPATAVILALGALILLPMLRRRRPIRV